MKVETAQLPGPDESDDRIFVTTNVVIMLDGASSFLPTPVPAGEYVDQLGTHLVHLLTENPEAGLVAALADGIEHTAWALDLEPGRAPSSTVAVTRVRSDNSVDALVLGDTQIAWPGGVVRDERIASVGTELREAHRERLAAGFGYDERHETLLRAMQEDQLRHRNRVDGYWIAEADPEAARHALMFQVSTADAPWCVLTTDGAYRPMEVHGWDAWDHVASFNSEELLDLLRQCEEAEATDPDGEISPRAKKHDDKSVAAILL